MIYLHVPFCESFCVYCDFYSEICSRAQVGEYAAAIRREIFERKDEIRTNAELSGGGSGAEDTLYIGGGTPSVLPLSAFRDILDALGEVIPSRFDSAGKALFREFTVEANPEDILRKGEEYLGGLVSMGVNRISMGVQSLDDGILRWMNRRHDSAGALKAMEILGKFPLDISIDLIFGLPQLSSEQWKGELLRVVNPPPGGRRKPEHISAYQLTIEEGSALGKMVSEGRWREASDETCREQYDILCSTLEEAGYRHYEISNFALKGHEAVHNSAYWRRAPYVGLGPGAHSLTRAAAPSPGEEASPEERRAWNEEKVSHYTSSFEILSPEDIRTETIMLGLRTAEGLDSGFLVSSCGKDRIYRMLSEGLLESIPEGNLRIPEEKMFVSEGIILDLI